MPSADAAGRIVFQASTEGTVSLTLPLDPNAPRVQGAIVRQSFEAGPDEGRNSLDAAGRWLAYPKYRPNEGEIWAKDLVTGQERHVVTTPRVALNPVIAPDGTKIAYVLPEGGMNTVYVVPASGGTARKVCDGCGVDGWFADNRHILSIDRTPDGRGGLVTVVDTVDGTRKDLAIDPQGRFGRVDVSRDGRWLSFSSRRRIMIAPVRPGSPPPESEWVTVLTAAAGAGERACGWSPDGRWLYLLLERDGFRDLYAQRVDPARGTPVGEPVVVQHLHDPRRRWGSTPYGTAIVDNAVRVRSSRGDRWHLAAGHGPQRCCSGQRLEIGDDRGGVLMAERVRRHRQARFAATRVAARFEKLRQPIVAPALPEGAG